MLISLRFEAPVTREIPEMFHRSVPDAVPADGRGARRPLLRLLERALPGAELGRGLLRLRFGLLGRQEGALGLVRRAQRHLVRVLRREGRALPLGRWRECFHVSHCIFTFFHHSMCFFVLMRAESLASTRGGVSNSLVHCRCVMFHCHCIDSL